jgi:predicted Zn finger-like uncharacterized protein
MIITCEECSTRFNLDESILKPGGSKVRCSLCKHIFTAFPQIPAPPLASDFEEEIEFDLPEETQEESETDGFEADEFEANEFETNEFETDKSDLAFDESDFDETDFELDNLDFETEDSQEEDETGLGMEDSKGPANIEINFDEGTEALETQGNLEFDEDDLIFDDADMEFTDPDLEMTQEEAVDFGSTDQDSLALEINKEPEDIAEDELEADLSFEDDTGADLIFEESGPESALDQILELDTTDDQNMSFPKLAMETQGDEPPAQESDQKSPSTASDQDSFESTASDQDSFEPSDPGLDEFDFEEEQDLPDSETRFEESIPEPGDDFSSYDQVLDQDTEPEEEVPHRDRATIEVKEPATTPEEHTEGLIPPELDTTSPKKRTKRSAMASPVMLLGLIFILVAGAYIASMILGYKIPYLSDVNIPILENLFKKDSPEIPAPKPVPNEASVNGRFISNDTAGELFIITGQIKNPATIPYSHIQVKGTLITKGKVKAQTLIIFCGNIISEEILKTGNISDIHKQLGIKEGAHNSNINVKPGGSVPFMLVFSNLPENLENFTVEVLE